MIKLLTFLKRKPEQSREEFQKFWLAEHAPRAAVFPGLCGYVVNLVRDPADQPADALAELWFDDRAAVQQAYATEIGRQGSAHSRAHTFRREHFYATESMVQGTRPARPGFKLAIAAKRQGGMAKDDFFRALDSRMAPLLRALPGVIAAGIDHDDGGEVLNSGTEGRLEALRQEPVFDALLVAWFETEAALHAAADSAAASALLGALNTLAARMETLRVAEHRIV